MGRNTHLVPTGGMIDWTTTTAPTGWLLCNGAAVSRSTYATLFAVIGTTYGVGNGSTTFNVPNTVDKFIRGSATIVLSAGADDHVHAMPHTHAVNGNVNSTSLGERFSDGDDGRDFTVIDFGTQASSRSHAHGISVTSQGTNTADTASESNIPVYIGVPKIIKI